MPEFKIDHLGHQGDGVVLDPKGQFFVPFALPGEVVEGALEGISLQGMRIVRPSDQRVKPLCRHFKSCGGCVMQHASEDLQSDWRKDQIERPLLQVGIEKSLDDLHSSPHASRRRAVFVGRRTKAGGTICFHRPSSHDLVDVETCEVLAPAISDHLETLREIAALGASRRQTISIHVTAADNGIDVSVKEAKELNLEETQKLAKLPGIVRLFWNGDILFQIEPPILSFGNVKVPVPPETFLQASDHAAGIMTQFAIDCLHGAKRIADLFAGCGTFALALAQISEIDAFESEIEALEAMRAAWSSTTGLKRIAPFERDLFRNPLLASELKTYSAVVLDPPRAGGAAQIAEIAKSKVDRVAYISCNPASFARDARVLIDAGFELQRLEGLDQFRWSKHIELQSYFSR